MDKELRRLSRGELLEMLIALTDENEKLKENLARAEARLGERQIAIDKAGSLAEAALSLNGIFQDAEAAARQYLENIEQLSGRQEAICQELLAQAEREADEIKREAQSFSARKHAEADAYWAQVVERAAALLKDQEALRQVVQSAGQNGAR